jgi:hypothetical protein
MNWYYVDAGKQAGPVDDSRLEELVREGKVQPTTLVWREGMGDWRPYGEAKPPSSASPGTPPLVSSVQPDPLGSRVCSICGRTFPQADVIGYQDKWVCGSCKPIFFQRLREGAPLITGTGGATEADLLARDYEVDVGGCLSQAWELFKVNAGIMMGASALVCLALLVTNVIPYLNIILALIFTGPILGGFWLFHIRKVRNLEAGVEHAFGGFGPKFWQLVLTQLIPAVIAMGFVFVIAMVMAITIPAVLVGSRSGTGGGRSYNPVVFIPLGILFFIFMLAMIYLKTCWFFALPLVADKGLKFWPALELSRRVVCKHWWMTFWLLLVSWVVMLVGLIACFAGALVTWPVGFSALTFHYQKVFGDLVPNQS